MKQYNQLDLFKFLSAIVVVAIHTKPFQDYSETFTWYFDAVFANMAVPFFFITSGFLLFSRLKCTEKTQQKYVVKKYIRHILHMYIVWTVIWLPWKILNFYNQGRVELNEALIYFRDILIGSSGDALWYLSALLVAVLVVYRLHTLFRSKVLIILLCGGAYAFGTICASCFQVLPFKSIILIYHTLFESENYIFAGGLL